MRRPQSQHRMSNAFATLTRNKNIPLPELPVQIRRDLQLADDIREEVNVVIRLERIARYQRHRRSRHLGSQKWQRAALRLCRDGL